MAERRMFTKKITDADAFTELPPTSQALYFHLCMGADDDGFSNQIRRAMFSAHADQHDFELLVKQRLIIPFESGVIVIKHWRMHNLIKSDRYKETSYIEEKATLILKNNGVYDSEDTGTQMEPNWNQIGTQVEPQVRLGKDSIDKVRLGEDSISCFELSNSSEPPEAVPDVPPIILNDGSDWYPSVEDMKGWKKLYPGVDVKRELARMREWALSNPTKRKTKKGIRRFVQSWLDREQNRPRGQPDGSGNRFNQFKQNQYDFEELEKEIISNV